MITIEGSELARGGGGPRCMSLPLPADGVCDRHRRPSGEHSARPGAGEAASRARERPRRLCHDILGLLGARRRSATGWPLRCSAPILGSASWGTAAGRWWPRRKARRCWTTAPLPWWMSRPPGCGRRLGDRITEIAVAVVHGGRCEMVFDSLVNPERPIPPRHLCHHQHHRRDGAPRAPVLRPGGAGARRARGAGIRGPQRPVRLEFRERGAAAAPATLSLDGTRLCTVRLARRLVQGVRSCGLDNLCRFFGFQNRARHRAAGDALVTAELLSRLLLLARQEGARTLQDLASIESRRRLARAGGSAGRCRRSRGRIPARRSCSDAAALVHGGRASLPHARRRAAAARRRSHVRGGAEDLWKTRIEPDERNRIPLAMRCLLVEHPDGLVLIDTRWVTRRTQSSSTSTGWRTRDWRAPPSWRTRWPRAGFLPRESSGSSTPTCISITPAATPPWIPSWRTIPAAHIRPTFPNATYVVQRESWSLPATPTSAPGPATCLTISSRSPRRIAGGWSMGTAGAPRDLGASDAGARALPPGGDARDRGETAVFVADLFPTSAHLPLPWIMGYDLEPLRTSGEQARVTGRRVGGGWRLIFEHDPRVAFGVPVMEGKAIVLKDVTFAPDPATAVSPLTSGR